MNEFIVWDDDNKCFKYDTSVYQGSAFVAGGEIIRNATFHNYIGKTDIEGNNIYTDSSIIEFEYYEDGEWITYIGYFSFDDENLRYELLASHEDIELDFDRISSLRILGSLQENKELLK